MEKRGLAEVMGEEEEVTVVEAAAAMAEAGAMVEAEEAMVKEGEAEVMEEEEATEETDHPNAIEALLQLRKVRRLTLQLNLLGDAGMESLVSTIL